MRFTRQEYWSVLPFPPPGDLSDPEIKPAFPAEASGFLTTDPPGKPIISSITGVVSVYHNQLIRESLKKKYKFLTTTPDYELKSLR